jgi:hypothetical protein
MAIPTGTKFHGVAPDVKTKNLGSQQANAQRDVYTFPDDFKLPSYLSFAGTMINVGGSPTSASILGGDTADFGTTKSTSSDHIGFVIVTVPCKVISVGWKWASSVNFSTAAGQPEKELSFKLSKSTDLGNGNLVGDASVWQSYDLATRLDSDNWNYPGFIEDVSGLDIQLDAGNVITITAITNGTFSNSGEEANVVITVQPL